MEQTPTPRKKPYQAPKLYGVSAIEASSANCCKTTLATCSNSGKNAAGGGKSRTNVTS